MDIKLPKYLDEAVQERLHNITANVVEIIPEKPVEVFVSTTSNQGQLNYLGIWLFTSNLAIEIRHPLSQHRIQFDIFRFKKAIDWIRLNARSYDFSDPVENSQLDLEFTTVDSASGVLSANGQGCRHLMQIYKNRFVTNFI